MDRDKELLSISDAAGELGIIEASLYEAVRTGRITSERVLGRIGIPRSALEEYRARTRPDGAKPTGRPKKS